MCNHGCVTATRLITLDDVPGIADLIHRGREFFAPWEPERSEDYFTTAGQRMVITDALARHAAGTNLPHVILDEQQRVVGRITLNDIVRGPFQSCHLGYWLNGADNGRGLASAAVRDIIRIAFEEMGLHRIQAGTLLYNVRSQRVLERTGFVRFGVAPQYLKIAGQWQDHVLFQLVNSAMA
jgi:ribosomal-protein-alanine N-acetyltransferase